MRGQLLRPQKAGAGQTWAWLGALLCLGAEEGGTDRDDGVCWELLVHVFWSHCGCCCLSPLPRTPTVDGQVMLDEL